MIVKIILGCALFFLSEVVCMLPKRSLIIITVSGPVKGKLNVFNGIEYYTYEGIPYAESPTGKLRFKPPVPIRPWTDVFDATNKGAVCSQPRKYYEIEETKEDCLNINVYVPKNGKDRLLPVMVFVHPGSLHYMSGRNDYMGGPQFLLDREIIFVSMNYRLGPFGFLSLDIEEASGNVALKDVILSLKWVKINIKNFGGDPDKITLFGHSSGGVIVNLLMLTNQTNGMFNQVIQMSGSAFPPRCFAKYSKDLSFALAKELGIKTDNVYDTLENLQKVDALEILRAFSNMSQRHDSPLTIYAPYVITKEVESDHALFVIDPMEALRKKYLTSHKVPILLGITSQEAINMIPYVLEKTVGMEKLRKNPEYLIPSRIEYPMGSQRSKNLAKVLNDMYFGGDMQNFTLSTLIQFMTDTQNVYSDYFWIKKYKNMTGSKLFLYLFDFDGDLNRRKFFFKSNVTGAGHGDDMPYIFLTNFTRDIYDSVDKKSSKMMKEMINFVSNFVYYGNPTPENMKNDIAWREYDEKQNYLLINDIPVVQTFSSTPMYSRMLFWEKVYEEYYEYVENGGEIEKKIMP